MDRLLASAIVGSAAGILGSGLGCLLGFVAANPSQKAMAGIMSAAGGIMLSMVLLDLFPSSLSGNLWPGTCGIAIGAAFMLLIRRLFEDSGDARAADKPSMLKMSIMIGAGIAAHNFPEGLAMGSGMASPQGGAALAFAIILHDMPEGLAMAIPLRMAGKGAWTAVLYVFLAGLPTGIGALIGYLVGSMSVLTLDLCLGFAGGAMAAIVFVEMLPASWKISPTASGRGLLLGVALGIIILILAGHI
ncbi:MAG: ZIP family metal transporter [Christensenellales bacterium]|jgi:ZIP family zinc transporter